MTVDPLFEEGFQAYSYCMGSPQTLRDPSGLRHRHVHLRHGYGWLPFPPLPPTPGPTFGQIEKIPCEYCLPYPYFDPTPSTQFGYGNWCGKGRPGAGNCIGKPVDQLDSCCMAHDGNLGKYGINGEEGCAHCMLATCAEKADCSSSPTPLTCELARSELVAGMRELCKIERLTQLKCWFV